MMSKVLSKVTNSARTIRSYRSMAYSVEQFLFITVVGFVLLDESDFRQRDVIALLFISLRAADDSLFSGKKFCCVNYLFTSGMFSYKQDDSIGYCPTSRVSYLMHVVGNSQANEEVKFL